MKKLSKAALLLVMGAVLFTFGCSDGTIGDDFADDQYSPKGALVSATNVVTGFYDLASPATSTIAFDLSAEGETTSSVDAFNSSAIACQPAMSPAPAGVGEVIV